ncbi:MAG: glycosyltransferase family 4 protein [Leptospiraceae bacterium]|nr:glycosyltransferase family 4 protein [Leptospiraceae bacterium]
MNPRPKLALVTPIFSMEAMGGAEKIAFEYSLLLNEFADLTVLTTTAKNYTTWATYYEAGAQLYQGISVSRFSTQSERSPKKFNRFHSKLLKKFPDITQKEYEKWLELQGPNCPELVKFIQKNSNSFDLFIFVTYLYYPVIKSIGLVKEKSFWVPTLHDEKTAYFQIYKNNLVNEIHYSFNTPEEKNIFQKIAGYCPDNYSIIGMHVELPNLILKTILDKPYIVYVGRLDSGKGVGELIDFFIQFREYTGIELNLVLVGGGEYIWEKKDYILTKGFVSEKEKYELIYNSELLINSSTMESFSIVIMEAWLLGKSVLVNSKSETLQNHCKRSNGGLYYRDKESFIACLKFLLSRNDIRKKMGVNGKKYVELNYNLDVIRSKLRAMIFSKL